MQNHRPSDLGLLVIVGGPGGTGSSTIAKILAQKWKLHHVYAGAIMRNLCKNQDLNKCLQDIAANNSISDLKIDNYLAKISQRPNTLIESKTFAATATQKKIHCSVKIWITTSIESRVNRILMREGIIKLYEKAPTESKMYKEHKNKLLERESNDSERFKKLYNVTYSSPEQYNDIVLDSTGLNIPLTVIKLFKLIAENKKIAKNFPSSYLKY